jgi:hypothetical protein
MDRTTEAYDKFTDAFGFIVPLTVQIGMVTVSLIGIALNPLLAVGYSGLGIGAVLFAPRAFKKGMIATMNREIFDAIRYFVNWALLSGFSIFIGISFSLAGTASQTEVSDIVITIESDSQPGGLLYELEQDKKASEALIPGMKDEFDQSINLETTMSIQNRMDANDQEIRRIQSEIESRRNSIISGEATRQARSLVQSTGSESVFRAIPDAVSGGKTIPLIFWSVLMIGTELMIINSLTIRSQARERPQTGLSQEAGKLVRYHEDPLKSGVSGPDGEESAAITADDIRNYANVRYESDSWDRPLLRPHQSIEALSTMGVPERKYNRITDLAMRKDLFRTKDMDTYPAPFISRETFITQIQEKQ